jgi:hypothetical protein
MRAGVMAFVGARPAAKTEQVRPEARIEPPGEGWNPQEFARAQIRGLVCQLFCTTQARPLRQVVFSAVDAQTDAGEICRSVGEVLALETTMDVAVVGAGLERTAGELLVCATEMRSPLREAGTQVRGNLWLLPLDVSGSEGSAASLHRYMGALRREFEYSIVAARASAISDHAIRLAQFADGIVLVLSAQHTRREQARKIKATLEEAQARLSGNGAERSGISHAGADLPAIVASGPAFCPLRRVACSLWIRRRTAIGGGSRSVFCLCKSEANDHLQLCVPKTSRKQGDLPSSV